MQNRISLIALFASAAAFVGTPVFAQDADAFGQRFVEVLAASGVNLSYESATADGDTIVLSNFTVTVPDEDPVELPGDLTFTGVAEGPDGSFTAETATVGDIEFEEDGIAVVAANFLVEDITLPATYSAADLSSLFLYRHASAGPVTVTVDGNEVLTIESFVAETTGDETEVNSSYAMTGIVLDVVSLMAEMDDDEAEEVLAALEAFEIERLVANLSGAGTWWPETGEAELTDLRFEFVDLGALSLSGRITGYTAELYSEMMKMQQKIAASAETMNDAELDAMEEAALSMFQEVGLASFALRYEDASLFNKALAYAAAEQGVEPSTLASGLEFMVPMMMSEFGSPELSRMVTGAIEAFVADPQSLTISANPPQPLYFNDFIGVEEDPFALIDILGLTVTANQ